MHFISSASTVTVCFFSSSSCEHMFHIISIQSRCQSRASLRPHPFVPNVLLKEVHAVPTPSMTKTQRQRDQACCKWQESFRFEEEKQSLFRTFCFFAMYITSTHIFLETPTNTPAYNKDSTTHLQQYKPATSFRLPLFQNPDTPHLHLHPLSPRHHLQPWPSLPDQVSNKTHPPARP